jgi:hypothetical protein
MKDRRGNRMCGICACTDLDDMWEMVVVPRALDLRKNLTEVHGESNNDELVFQTDDSSANRDGLQLIEAAGDVMNRTEVEIFRYFKPVVEESSHGTGQTPTEKHDFIAGGLQFLALGTQRLRREGKEGSIR